MPKAKGTSNPQRTVVCVDCGEAFKTQAQGRERCKTCQPPTYNRVKPPNTFVCVDCGEAFETQARARERCDGCQRAYRRVKQRELHHESIGEFVCVDCGAVIDPPLMADGSRKPWRPNRCPEHDAAYKRSKRVRWRELRRYRNHGITEQDYLDLLERQGNRCAICGTDTPGNGLSWAIDHDHTCCDGPFGCAKCVRGLLCSSCNPGIGYFRDNPQLLKAAMDYLNRDLVRQILNSPNRDEDGNLIPE